MNTPWHTCSEAVGPNITAIQDLWIRNISGLLTLALIFTSMILHAGQPERQSLFKIERSKNANVVQYDAQIGSDGKLHREEPVIAYWIRLAEQGQIQELSWIQRKFAYGFKTSFHDASDSVTLKMATGIDQPIQVRFQEGKYRAMVEINGHPSELERIFIQAHSKGISITVDHMDIFGNDLKTGQETYMRITP